MNTSKRYAPEVRQRVVGMVFDHAADDSSQWTASGAIAPSSATRQRCCHQATLLYIQA